LRHGVYFEHEFVNFPLNLHAVGLAQIFVVVGVGIVGCLYHQLADTNYHFIDGGEGTFCGLYQVDAVLYIVEILFQASYLATFFL